MVESNSIRGTKRRGTSISSSSVRISHACGLKSWRILLPLTIHGLVLLPLLSRDSRVRSGILESGQAQSSRVWSAALHSVPKWRQQRDWAVPFSREGSRKLIDFAHSLVRTGMPSCGAGAVGNRDFESTFTRVGRLREWVSPQTDRDRLAILWSRRRQRGLWKA